MTIPTIRCEQFGDLLADFLERDIDEATRARLESHALTCADCGSLLADLRRLRIDAAALPALAPSRDLWSSIAARIETPVVELAPSGRSARESVASQASQRRQRPWSPAWMGLAAAGLVAITAGVPYQLPTRTTDAPISPATRVAVTTDASGDTSLTVPQPTRPGAGAKDTTGQRAVRAVTPLAATARNGIPGTATQRPTTSLASHKLSPEQTYDLEITRLRAIITQRRSTLDTATVGVIERNLKVIDDAISQCRTALLKDPASRFLLESLNDALDTKIQLLRTAAMLPART